MTLGGAPEALTFGYLRNQRLVDRSRTSSGAGRLGDQSFAMKTRKGLADLEAKTSSAREDHGCGQGTVFGDLMEEVDNMKLPPDTTLSQATLYDFSIGCDTRDHLQAGGRGPRLRAGDEWAGPSEILMFVEGVGRHNAVDAIAGRMWLDASTAATRSSTPPAA